MFNKSFRHSLISGFCNGWTLIDDKKQVDFLNTIFGQQETKDFFTETRDIKYPDSYPCLMTLEGESNEAGTWYHPIYLYESNARELVEDYDRELAKKLKEKSDDDGW